MPDYASIDWQQVRSLVEMHPDYTYLNTGTSSLVPKTVHRASLECRTKLHHNPTDYVWRAMGEELWKSRSRLASYIGTTPDRVIFFTNISQIINTFCMSVQLPKGSEILLSDHEYLAMRWAWERAARRHGWKIATFTLPVTTEDPQAIIDAMAAAITSDTKLLFTSHILYTTGMVLPMQAMCKLARSKGILTFIDGAHTPGMLPLNLSTLGADFYSSNLHKWFMSEVGTAFLYVAPGLEHHLEPWQVSWGYHYSRSTPHQQNEFGSTPWIRQFEMEGTRDLTPWFLVHHNCDFFEALGQQNIAQRQAELSNYCRKTVSGVGDLKLMTPTHPELRGGLTAFLVPPHIDGQLARKHLWDDDKVEINLIDHHLGQFLRVSTHVYNNEADVDKLATAVVRAWGKSKRGQGVSD